MWEIATQPYPEAHFATYPEELVRRALLAGCPEWVCRVCGTPRVRLTQTERGFDVNGRCRGCGRPRAQHVVSAKSIMSGSGGSREVLPPGSKQTGSATRLEDNAVPCAANATVGWSDCGCEPLPADFGQGRSVQSPVPSKWRAGVVLDPFFGSGTTGHVARKHGRRTVGIELNHAYCELAARRLQQLSLLADVPEPEPPRLVAHRGLTGGAYSPPGQSPHSNARKKR